jgi:hypothetical protein
MAFKATSLGRAEAFVKEKFSPFSSATSTATSSATATGNDEHDTIILSNTIASELATKHALITAFKALPGFSNDIIGHKKHYNNELSNDIIGDTTNYETTTNTSVLSTSTKNQIVLKNSPPNLDPFIPQKNGIYLGELFKTIGGVTSPLKISDRPWVDQKTNTIDISKIPYVNGNVSATYYDSRGSIFSITEDNNYRYFKGNLIPNTHMGIFPIQEGTEAYPWYAALPGGINPKTGEPYSSAAAIGVSPLKLDLKITKYPKYNETPEPINSLTIGVTLTGTVWHAEVAGDSENNWYNPISVLPMDECFGHPYAEEYHLHAYSWKCLLCECETVCECEPTKIKNSFPSPLIGYALDGFGIYGPYDKDGNIITNDQLDECHGLTSEVMWEGKMTNIYHYVVNYEYPYTIGAFRGTVDYNLVFGNTVVHPPHGGNTNHNAHGENTHDKK